MLACNIAICKLRGVSPLDSIRFNVTPFPGMRGWRFAARSGSGDEVKKFNGGRTSAYMRLVVTNNSKKIIRIGLHFCHTCYKTKTGRFFSFLGAQCLTSVMCPDRSRSRHVVVIWRSESWEICQLLVAALQQLWRHAQPVRWPILVVRRQAAWWISRTSCSWVRRTRRTCVRSVTERCATQWSSATADIAVVLAALSNSFGQSPTNILCSHRIRNQKANNNNF